MTPEEYASLIARWGGGIGAAGPMSGGGGGMYGQDPHGAATALHSQAGGTPFAGYVPPTHDPQPVAYPGAGVFGRVDTGLGGPRPSTPSGTILPGAGGRDAYAGYGAAPALPAGWGDTGPMVARPTEPQLNAWEGHNMSMPPMGSGMATGATAANPTPGYGPPQSAGAPGAGPFGAANLAYAADPVTWALNYGRAHGHVPGGGRTQMGDFLQQLWGNMAQAIFSLAPDLGTLDPTALMNNILYGGANTMGANAGAFADQALGDLRGKTGSMDESQQLKLLNAYDALKTLGRNPYWQNARENQLQGALEQYKNRNLMQYGAQGQEPPSDLFSFIMGRPGIDIYGR